MAIELSLEDTRRLLIAVAITALKHKPVETSITAYLFHLKSCFPLPVTINSDDSSSFASIWRQRAAQLEDELMKLKNKYNIDCAELSVLSAKLSAASLPEARPASLSGTNALTAPAPKKKKKRTTHVDGDNSNPGAVSLTISRWNSDCGQSPPVIAGGLRVLSSLQQLQVARSGITQKAAPIPVERIMLLVVTVIDGLGRRLSPVLQLERKPSGDVRDIVRDVDRILFFALDTAFEAIPTSTIKKSAPLPAKIMTLSSLLDQVFGSLTSKVLLPIIKCIRTHSAKALQSRLTHGASKSQTTETFPDVRNDLLTMLKRCLRLLRDHERSVLRKSYDLFILVATVTAKEIVALWASTDSPDQQMQILRKHRLTRQGRIARLGRKETLALLCSLLHDTLSSVSNSVRPSTHSHFAKTDTVIAEVALDEMSGLLSRLLNRCSDQSGLRTDIEKGLMMAVIEKGWLEGMSIPVVDME